MKTTDIKDLVIGILALIGVALTVGQYGNLQKWARREFAKSLTSDGWHSTSFFSHGRHK